MSACRIRYMTGLCAMLLMTAAAGAVTWDYVYESDINPIAPGAITDATCSEVGRFDVADAGGTGNLMLNGDGTVTIDDQLFGALVYTASVSGGLWALNTAATIEMLVKFEASPPPPTGNDSFVFLSVNNFQSGFGFRWFMDFDDIENTVYIQGDQIAGEPPETERLDLGPDPGWIRVRVNVPADPFTPPVLWAWDEAGNPGTNPDTGAVTCVGFDYASSAGAMNWGDLWSTELEGAMTWDYVRWIVGEAYGPEVAIDDPLPCPCGRWGYQPSDFDENCTVDLLDYAVFAEEWNRCTDPAEAGCENLLAGESGTAVWEYVYECDDLPGVVNVIKNAATGTGVGQWTGTGAVASPDGVVSAAGGMLEINDVGIGGNHYCSVDDSGGLWTGRGTTVEIRMSLTDWVSPNNIFALTVSDGTDRYQWFVTETYITGSPGGFAIDMTSLQTLRVAWPEAGPPTMYVDYNGGIQQVPGYHAGGTSDTELTFGDIFSNESGRLTYDYIRWTTQGAYDLNTTITMP